MSFINTLQNLDNAGYYKEADTLFKTAFDLTPFTSNDNKLGQGVFGAFYSNFDKEKAKQIGREQDLGLKVFHKGRFETQLGENIQEFVAFRCFAPLINKLTLFKAPRVEEQSLSSFLGNKSIISQKMPGINIGYNGDNVISVNSQNEDIHLLASNLIDDLNSFIMTKLEQLTGIEWVDCSVNNFLLGPNAVKEFTKAVEELYEHFLTYGHNDPYTKALAVIGDWGQDYLEAIYETGQIYIIDFGLMYPVQGSVAYEAVDKFYNALTEKFGFDSTNFFIKKILISTERMLGGMN